MRHSAGLNAKANARRSVLTFLTRRSNPSLLRDSTSKPSNVSPKVKRTMLPCFCLHSMFTSITQRELEKEAVDAQMEARSALKDLARSATREKLSHARGQESKREELQVKWRAPSCSILNVCVYERW